MRIVEDPDIIPLPSHTHTTSDITDFPTVSSSSSDIASNNTKLVTGGAVYSYISGLNLSGGSGDNGSSSNTPGTGVKLALQSGGGVDFIKTTSGSTDTVTISSSTSLDATVTISNNTAVTFFTLSEGQIVVGQLYCINLTMHKHTMFEIMADNTTGYTSSDTITHVYSSNGNNATVTTTTSSTDKLLQFNCTDNSTWKLGFHYNLYTPPNS